MSLEVVFRKFDELGRWRALVAIWEELGVEVLAQLLDADLVIPGL